MQFSGIEKTLILSKLWAQGPPLGSKLRWAHSDQNHGSAPEKNGLDGFDLVDEISLPPRSECRQEALLSFSALLLISNFVKNPLPRETDNNQNIYLPLFLSQ